MLVMKRQIYLETSDSLIVTYGKMSVPFEVNWK